MQVTMDRIRELMAKYADPLPPEAPDLQETKPRSTLTLESLRRAMARTTLERHRAEDPTMYAKERREPRRIDFRRLELAESGVWLTIGDRDGPNLLVPDPDEGRRYEAGPSRRQTD